MVNLEELKGLVERLREICKVIEHWLEWVNREREAEGLTTEPDTHLIFGYENAPPSWPTVGQMSLWIEIIRGNADTLERLAAEVLRLREALEEIGELTEHEEYGQFRRACQDIARKALGGSEG